MKLKKIILHEGYVSMSANEMKSVLGGQVANNVSCGLKNDKCSGTCGYQYGNDKKVCTMFESNTSFGTFRSCDCI